MTVDEAILQLNKVREEFLACVLGERLNQDEQWGGPRHDDEHIYFNWLSFIRKQTMKKFLFRPSLFEVTMVKIAALAMAAYESSRRKNPVDGIKRLEVKDGPHAPDAGHAGI
jgi:hypothetical protein